MRKRRTAPDSIKIQHLADSALRVELVTESGPAATARVVGLTTALERAEPPGLLDLLPSYVALVVTFDPVAADPDELEALILRLAGDLPDHPATVGRRITLPVVYGGEAGPDLVGVAEHTGLSAEEVIARHAGADYLVACLGFAPGFPFLMGLPPELATPRLTSPRTSTPAGSVAIGGEQTGVYPLDTPGGWRVIGRTPVPLFDLSEDDPFLMRAGDTLRFDPTTPETAAEIASSSSKRRYAAIVLPEGVNEHPLPAPPCAARPEVASTVRVVEPGLLTTVQDLGRPGLERFGVTRGGAVDRRALILGNRLVGNDPNAAALEITLSGPRLAFDSPMAIALAGTDLGATLDGQALPIWQPVLAPAGSELAFGAPAGHGARAYLCVAGGIAVPTVLGSRATDLTGHFGGIEGRPLRAGDQIPIGPPPGSLEMLLRRRLSQEPPGQAAAVELRVVLGPQQHRFTDAGIAALLEGVFTASTKADRMGVRLQGPAVELSHGADMLSEGIAPGTVQVPGDGQPIALLTPRQTVGGYPKIATIVSADLDRLAQVRPGNTVTFTAVDVSEARRLALAYHATLGDDAVTIAASVTPGWTSSTQSAQCEGKMGQTERIAWDPEGVVRVIEAAQAAGVTALRLEVDGLVVDLQRGTQGAAFQPHSDVPLTETSASEQEPEAGIVRAPMLGIFYRKSSPDAPPFVEPGETVEAGQTLGLIEVMKTYHEVTAPSGGTIAEFLAEDGAFVEYNQPLVRLNANS
ncbi:MAG TPA: 5-oxoprolinase subunit PxpB [Thermomicrobiales bacterium]|nr:5-oxoprolinase subunit PxpB [Thermomicrobiales bacterium]